MKVKTVSAKAILGRVSSMGLSGSGWNGIALDYIGDAIRGIGYHIGFEKVTNLSIRVDNYRAQIPCNLESITDIKLNGCSLALAYDEDGICNRIKRVANYSDILEYNKYIDQIYELQNILQENPTDEEALVAMQNALNQSHRIASNVGVLGDNCKAFNGHWFKIENSTIHTSFESGTIELDGSAFLLDEEGFPMIIDTYKYTTAVFWYVMYQLLLGEYDSPKVTWKDAEDRWEEFRQRAANEPKIMGKQEMERFALRWNSIYKDKQATYSII